MTTNPQVDEYSRSFCIIKSSQFLKCFEIYHQCVFTTVFGCVFTHGSCLNDLLKTYQTCNFKNLLVGQLDAQQLKQYCFAEDLSQVTRIHVEPLIIPNFRSHRFSGLLRHLYSHTGSYTQTQVHGHIIFFKVCKLQKLTRFNLLQSALNYECVIQNTHLQNANTSYSQTGNRGQLIVAGT